MVFPELIDRDAKGIEQIRVVEMLQADGVDALVVDGFSGYCRIRSESCGRITLQRCLAHLRRKVLDCLKGTPAAERAGHPARRIAEEISAIYAAEGSMEGAPDERLLLRRGEEYMGHVGALRSLFASLDPDEGTALFRAKEYFDNLDQRYMDSLDFSNARFVRNLYERTWSKAAVRMQMSGGSEICLKGEDFNTAAADREFSEKLMIRKSIGF